MTDRLYYNNQHRRAFEARVTGVTAVEDRVRVTLDQTCFYPTSGGQPFDTGHLGPWRVLDVEDLESGDVVHTLEAAATSLRVDQAIAGANDWPRRFDHMQQHTGQHLLSAAFDRSFGVRTVGFHLGGESSTIDLAREVATAEIASAEDEANQILWENKTVAVRYATAEEAATLPLRKESARGGTLRLIEIADIDLSACGGTHVGQTGAVGLIAVVAWERFKGGTRLEFVCGGRALRWCRAMRDAAAAASRLLSIGAPDVPAAIERLLEEGREHRRARSLLNLELTGFRADRLASTAEITAQGHLVLASVDADANVLKALASSLALRPGFLTVLISASRPVNVVVARASDLDLSARDLLVSLASTFGGRGGGKPDLAQGGGLDAAPEPILAEARRLIVG